MKPTDGTISENKTVINYALRYERYERTNKTSLRICFGFGDFGYIASVEEWGQGLLLVGFQETGLIN